MYLAARTFTRPISEPTDRSIPPEMITLACPIAANASGIAWPDDPAAIADVLANASAKLPADSCRAPQTRSFISLAIEAMPIGPVDWMLRIMGRRLAATRSASSRETPPSSSKKSR